jgi:cyclase
MLRPRLIPILLLLENSLVKTCQFKGINYIGDPCNTARIFNEVEVDELIVLDIGCTNRGTSINYKLLKNLADECFMPLTYGGGVKSVEDAAKLFEIGIEKVALNSAAILEPSLIGELANEFGSQAVVVSIDSFRNQNDAQVVRKTINTDPVTWAIEAQGRGAGEILLTSVDREGTWLGLDLKTIKEVASSIQIPLIAHGGAKSLQDVRVAISTTGATSIGIGNLAVYQKADCGVLVHYPQPEELDELFNV